MEPCEGCKAACPYQVFLVWVEALHLSGTKNSHRNFQAFGFRQSGCDHCLFSKHSAQELNHDIKHHLDGLSTIRDLELAKYFLGLEITKSPLGTSITQRKYILDMLTDTGLLEASNWLQMQLVQFLKYPCQVHWYAATHLLRYLKRCPSKGLTFRANDDLYLTVYFDMEWPTRPLVTTLDGLPPAAIMPDYKEHRHGKGSGLLYQHDDW
ncbi:UNVERIFIED_CONTAM: hypothetical protein Sradi_1203300 [Sesamum radiatum]|uniref:Retrovirus-related Pol polyprotein from transposon RE1 n=1 Tax=Sesamum radiatum TaxID=300843 RepID=A0AAW2UL84_SESRA